MSGPISRASYALNACDGFFNLKNSHFTCKETKAERGNVVFSKITHFSRNSSFKRMSRELAEILFRICLELERGLGYEDRDRL